MGFDGAAGSTELAYGASSGFVDLCPINGTVAGHAYRCDGRVWTTTDTTADDTQGSLNVACSCVGDVTSDGAVDVDDIVAVVLAWGETGCGNLPADVDMNQVVDIDDLVTVVLNFGSCN
ncbi:MAG: hypothetical protein GY716_14180 [bacterium]|nr:hypothetical protein [bacterium]